MPVGSLDELRFKNSDGRESIECKSASTIDISRRDQKQKHKDDAIAKSFNIHKSVVDLAEICLDERDYI